MMGEHQIYNACLAIEVLSVLGIDYPFIKSGLEKMKLIGRFEKLSENIYVDGGHNPQGAKSISETVEFHSIESPVFIVSMVKDKDMKNYLEILEKKGKVILTSFDSALCHDPSEFPQFETVSFDDAVKISKANKDKTYIFCGSLYQINLVISAVRH